MRKVVLSVVTLVLLGLVTGCVGLQVERYALADYGNRLHIPMVANKTLEYGAEEVVTDVLIVQFSRDGRVQVVEQAPDLILDATLTEYELLGRDYDEDERVVGKHLRVRVLAAVLDARTGDVVVPEQTFASSGSFFADARPDARRENDVFLRLSQAMISSIIEGW